ncbi:MAG: hypothetical protein ABIH70_00860 [Chloroflexota bacterium]
MINKVVRFVDDMVLVFDEIGEQTYIYDGHYDELKMAILLDAPADVVFADSPGESGIF